MRWSWPAARGAVGGRIRPRSSAQSALSGFAADLPFVLVDVELAEQPELRLIGRLLDGVHAPLRLGAPVTVAFEDLPDGMAVPAFVLDAES